MSEIYSSDGYLRVLEIGEGNADADDGARVVVGEVEPLADFAAAHGQHQRAVRSTRAALVAFRRFHTTPVRTNRKRTKKNTRKQWRHLEQAVLPKLNCKRLRKSFRILVNS